MKRTAIVSSLTMAVAVTTLWLRSYAAGKGPITPARFSELHGQLLARSRSEPWTQIPWTTDLWEARRRAGSEGKPIFMWAMNGHPLGCT